MAWPVPAGTVLFMISTCSEPSGRSSTTARTRERSASPEAVGGVSTQTNSSRASASNSSIEVVKCRRSALRRSRSSIWGSWMVTSPRASDSTFSGTMSRATTRWPSSAKQAAVTSPTQPTPTTPMLSRSRPRSLSRSSSLTPQPYTSGSFRGRLIGQPLDPGLALGDRHIDRSGYAHHLIVGKGLQEAVGDPVRVTSLVPGNHPNTATVGVHIEVTPGHGHLLMRGTQDRRVGPAADALHVEEVTLG